MTNNTIGHRLTLAQVALLVLIGFVGLFYPGKPNAILGLTGFLTLVVGVFLIFWASMTLGSNFTIWPNPKPKSSLNRNGPYKHMRHPIYSGLILFSIGWTLVSTSLLAGVLTIILIIILLLKSNLEESILIKRFDGYGRYTRKTGRFLPARRTFR